jgi:hypothetical protein
MLAKSHFLRLEPGQNCLHLTQKGYKLLTAVSPLPREFRMKVRLYALLASLASVAAVAGSTKPW